MIKRGDRLSDEVLEALELVKEKKQNRKLFDECLRLGVCPNCGDPDAIYSLYARSKMHTTIYICEPCGFEYSLNEY